jgi:hypothetical protein
MKQEQQQKQLQFNLQITDDTWERLLCALERLEYVTEEAYSPYPVATRLDNHKDKENIQESCQEIELEVHLQIKAFKFVVATVREEAEHWLSNDFIKWMSGRKGLSLNRVDDYAIPILQCILGEKFSLPEISDLPKSTPSKENMRDTIEELGKATHEIDNKQKEFSTNPEKQATQNIHQRGEWKDGMDRLRDIAQALKLEPWFKCFVQEKRWQGK